MRDTIRCPDCGGRRIWHVAEAKDRAGVTGPFTIWEGRTALSTAELYVCGTCGRVEWYAPQMEREPPSNPETYGPIGCPSCRGLRVVVVPAYDAIGGTVLGRQQFVPSGAESTPMPARVEGDEEEGRLALRVCRHCARVTWRALERESLGREDDVREPGDCLDCGADQRFRIPSRDLRSIDYSGGALLPLERHLRSERRAITLRTSLLGGERPWGTLDAILCKPCGAVTWSAGGLEQLRDDPKAGVRLVPVPDAAGPYR